MCQSGVFNIFGILKVWNSLSLDDFSLNNRRKASLRRDFVGIHYPVQPVVMCSEAVCTACAELSGSWRMVHSDVLVSIKEPGMVLDLHNKLPNTACTFSLESFPVSYYSTW